MSSVLELLALRERAPSTPGVLNAIVAAFRQEGSVELLRRIASDTRTSSVAGYILSELGDQSWRYDECVLEFLSHPEPSVRAGAITLSEFCIGDGDPRVWAALRLLGPQERDPQVKYRAATFLLRLDMAHLPEALARFAPRDDADVDFAGVMKSVLGAHATSDASLALLEGPWRVIVAYFAYMRKDPVATDAICLLMADDEPTSQQVGIALLRRAIAEGSDQTTKMRLSSVVFGLTSAGPERRRRAIRALAEERWFREIAPLDWIAGNQDRLLLYEWFARPRRQGAPDIEARLGSDDPSERAIGLSVALRERNIEALRRASSSKDLDVSTVADDELWVDGVPSDGSVVSHHLGVDGGGGRDDE